MDPTDAYSAIARYLGQSRSGHWTEATKDLASATAQVDKSKWPRPIIDLLAGRNDAAAVIRAASLGDKEEQRKQLCEATFYVGEWNLSQKLEADGRAMLEQAQRECPGDRPERFAASAELKRLFR